MHFKSYLVILVLKIVSLFLLQVCRFLKSEKKIASVREIKKNGETKRGLSILVAFQCFFLE